MFARLAVPKVNGIGARVGRGCKPRSIRAVRQVVNRRFMGAQNGDRPARAGIIDANVLLGSYGHQLAIGAEDRRFLARLRLPQDDDFLAGGGVPQPALAAGVERRNPAAVWAVRQREGRSFYPEQRQFSARRRVPEADGPVVGAGSNLLAVGAVGHRCHRSRVTAENGPALLGGHVVQVYVVVSKASYRDLPPRRAEHEPINSPAWHRPHVTGLVELAVDVLPLPVAVFLRRRLEGAADGGAVLQLQSGGRRGDVRSVALPAFGLFLALSLVAGDLSLVTGDVGGLTLFRLFLERVFRSPIAP